MASIGVSVAIVWPSTKDVSILFNKTGPTFHVGEDDISMIEGYYMHNILPYAEHKVRTTFHLIVQCLLQ